MTMISPTQSNVQAAMVSFLSAVLPGTAGTPPAVFVGSIVGKTMTVSRVIVGAIIPGCPVLGAAPGTTVISQISGPTGGAGVYAVSQSQTAGNPPTGATFSSGVSVIAGQPNRAVEPANPYFAVVTPPRFTRVATNVDSTQDVKFFGTIVGTVMSVSVINLGEIEVGASVFGAGVAAGTSVVALGTGSGGVGTYVVAPSQNIAGETLSAGWKTLMQTAIADIQIDFHSPDTLGGDFAQIVSTAIRDEFGVDFFADLVAPLNGVVPLYADDPHQVPFINAENQYEWRWILEAKVEVDQRIRVSQQFADAVDLTLVDVPAVYPLS